MLYDLNWLAEGQTFPPRSELERLKMYRDNRALFSGDISEVLAPYRERIKSIVSRFAGLSGYVEGSLDRFELDLNYFQLMTLKTGDLIAGEPPTITAKRGDIGSAIENTDFNNKLLSIMYDVSRFGVSVARLMLNEKKQKDFIVSSPDLWFPVVSSEDKSKILYHVIAWTQCLNPSATQYEKKNYVLKAQVHERGKYTAITFAVKDKFTITENRMSDNLSLTYDSFRLDGLLEKTVVTTGFADFAVVPFSNTTTSDSIFGLNDYDRITPILAELQVRYSLESLILDKHSAPTVCAPTKSLVQYKSGEWTLPLGGVIPIEPNDAPPQYLVWDAALIANHTMIEKLEKHLYSLSEMGAIISDDAFGASQGFEALETRMTNARLKSRRMSSALNRPAKCLLSELTGIPAEDISLCFNDGLPNNEYRETDIATKKVQGGLFDNVTALMEHFGKTLEDAEAIAERVRESKSNSMAAFNEYGEGGEKVDDGA